MLETLRDEGSAVLLDVGGGSHGSHMIGQFSHLLDGRKHWCSTSLTRSAPGPAGGEDIEVTMRSVLGARGLGELPSRRQSESWSRDDGGGRD